MQDLLKPDYGVLILTICNFLLLVFLLKKFAWKAIIGALESREAQIKTDKEQAAAARAQAEDIKKELDAKLAQISSEAAQKMQQAVAMGETQKNQLLAQAKEQAENLIAQAKAQIQAEKDKALSDVKTQIVSTAMLAAAKVAQQQINQESAQQVVEQVLADVQGK